jgi:hypothetical protein
MELILHIPDELSASIQAMGSSPSRAALEALAIEGYRTGALTAFQTRRLLGFETRYELESFLKAHNIVEGAYGVDDFEQDQRTMQRLQDAGRLKA